MLDWIVAGLVAQVAEEWKGALKKEMVVVVVVVVVVIFYFYIYIACHDMQFDDRVFQDVDEQEQEDGSRIYTYTYLTFKYGKWIKMNLLSKQHTLVA